MLRYDRPSAPSMEHWGFTMGWFGKPSHAKQVEAVLRLTGHLYERTTRGKDGKPEYLEFKLPDSRFRFVIFCLSLVHAACARHMTSPDAILNDVLYRLVERGVGDLSEEFFGDQRVEPQDVATRAGEYLQDYLHRWSAYIDMKGAGNEPAAANVLQVMLRHTESKEPIGPVDYFQIGMQASMLESEFPALIAAFKMQIR
jgi:hypothetical protein